MAVEPLKSEESKQSADKPKYNNKTAVSFLSAKNHQEQLQPIK